jgi:RHS repeat-associated protein
MFSAMWWNQWQGIYKIPIINVKVRKYIMKKLPYQITIFFVVFSLLVAPVAPAFAQEGTPEAPATAITETETPAATPGSETPVVEGTASPTLVPETPVSTQTPTPLVTETPTAVPSTQVVELQPALTLRTDPEFLTQADTVNLIWSLENVSLETQALVLDITLPRGFQADETSGTFNQQTNTLSIPVTTLGGSIALKVKNVREDSLFSASLIHEQEVLASSSIVLPLFEDFEVSKNGGKIDLRNGKIKVTFPQGALTEDVVINAGFPSADALPENFSASVFELRAFAKGEQESGVQQKREITHFSEPLTIEVDYSHLTLTEEQEGELYLYWYNPETGDWNALESSRDPQTKTLTAQTDHFTVFDVGVNDWNSTHLPTIDSFQVSEFTGAASFSLPLEVPAGPGGFQPDLTLAYNSQVVDQATTKAQASWVGMGWSLDGGGTITQDFTDGFTLTVNGISTKIMKEQNNPVKLRLEDENFWKIEFLGSGNTTYWKLWDKQGNVYTFTNIVNPYSLTTNPYQWNLTQMANQHGRIMRFNYDSESKTVSGEGRVTATYISSIVYPVQRYQVRFAREARTDYTAAWATDAAWHVFERSRLKTVYMEQDADGNGSFETVIRKYEFTYANATDPDLIWPGVSYSAGGKTLTLRSVQEFSGSGASLPAHTFNYDNLHLTSADNGYGGGVEFTYEEQPWVYSSTPASYQKSAPGCDGTMLGWGWYSVGGTMACASEWLNVTNGAAANYAYTNHPLLPENRILRPGGVYRYYYNAAPVTAGATYQTGLYTQSGDANDVQLAASNGATIYLTKKAASADLYFKAVTGTSKFHTISIWLMPSFYRVETKTITDGNGHSYTSTYEYTTPTAMINNEGLQFRGHAKVKVTNPDSTYTETTYFQGPYDKGRPNEACTHESNGEKISCTDNNYVMIPLPEVDSAGIIDHAWVYQSAQINRIYDANGTEVGGTKTAYTYESTYGNLTRTDEYDNPAGSGTPYRVTTTSYYPNSTTWLVGLPARQAVSANGTLLSEAIYYYNGATNYTTPPTANKLTRTHALVSPGQYTQTDYGYDVYGNQTNVTTYTGFAVTNGSGAPTGAQASTTVYDATYHVYPESVTNAAGQTTTLTYNYTLGLPLTQTDPNNAVTKADYDVFGRVVGVHKPDPATGSYESSASLTMSYVDSFPFTTTVTQVDTGYQIVKKYDGMGRIFETNAAGVITDTLYDSPTVTRQSTPHTSSETAYYTTTASDPASRMTTTTAPDGTVTSSMSNGFTTTVTDALGHSTISTSDVWGRATLVTPPTGPVVNYAYDPLGNLVQVARGSTLNNPPPATPGTSGLVSWWSMDETSGTRNDSSGANHLTSNGSVPSAAGLKINAANFTSSAQSLSLADNASISTGDIDFTWVTHVYVNAYSTGEVIVDKADSANVEYRLSLNPGTGFRFRAGTGQVDSGTAIAANAWYTVIAWHNAANDTLNIQVNNGVVQSSNYSGGGVDSTYGLSFGRATPGTSPFSGRVDEAALYKRVLTPTERTWFYNNAVAQNYTDLLPVNPGSTGLAAWWSLNEASGARNDSHGTNHLTDNNTVASTSGLKTNAASFVTANQEFLSIADNTVLSGGDVDFTISANVYLNSNTSTFVLLNKSDIVATSLMDYRIAYNPGLGFRFRVGPDGGAQIPYVDSGSDVTTGKWHHVIAWHDSASNTINIQVDNGAVKSAPYSIGPTDTTYPFTMGAYSNGATGLDGRVDEAAIYKRILTSSERAWLYNSGAGRAYSELTVTPPSSAGYITTLTYNEAGQKLTMSDPDMGNWSYTYDALGNLKTQTDARACTLTMIYDPLNRLTSKSSAGSGCGTQVNTSYAYDAGTNGIGRRTSMTSGSLTDSWTYDKRGRMLSATNQGYTTNFTYNNADMPLTMQYPDTETVTYGYNSRMLLNSLTGTNTYVTSTTYDSAGRVDQRLLGNSLTQNFDYYAWDANVSSVGQGGRLYSLLTGSLTGSLQDINYQYDAVGNIKNFTDNIASEISTYEYDSLDRLKSWTLGSTTETYDYNATTGNLETKAGTALAYADTAHKHAATSAGGNTYTYDANGNQITRVIGADTFNLAYDAENRLVEVKKNSTTIATFAYDADGVRVQATENGTLTKFVGGHYEVTGSQVTKYYMAGASRIAMRKYTVPSSMSVEYLLGDHLGSTSITTDNTGAKVSEMRYKPWGEVRYSWTASTSTTPSYTLADYTFTGQYSYMDDPSTSGVTEGFDLMFYNARWYDPYLARFAQADSIVPAGVQGYDRYAYVSNNPVKYTDPSGHCEIDEDSGICLVDKRIQEIRDNAKITRQIQSKFSNVTINNYADWNTADLREIYDALVLINGKNGFNGNTDAFIAAFGEVTFNPAATGSLGMGSDGNPTPANAAYWNGTINVTPEAQIGTIIHEMGHILDGRVRRHVKNAPLYSQSFVDQFNQGNCILSPCTNGGWAPSGKTTPYGPAGPMEDFADSFLALIKYGPQTSKVDLPRIVIIQSLIQSYIDYVPYSSRR